MSDVLSPLVVVAVMDDLMFLSRIDAAAASAGAAFRRVSSPANIGAADLVLVDWSDRLATCAAELAAWRSAHPAARVICFGRHTDLESHHAAKVAGLGPMWARSKLLGELPRLVSTRSAASVQSP